MFLTLAVGPLLLAGTLLAWQTFRVQKAQALALQQQISRRIADAISFKLAGVADELAGLASVYRIQSVAPGQRRSLLEALQAKHRALGELAYLDDRGREEVRISREDVLTERDLRDRSDEPEFRVPRRTGSVYFSPLAFDSVTGKPFLLLASPVKDLRRGTVSGVIVARVWMAPLWDEVIGESQGPGMATYVLSPDHRVVAHADGSVVLRGTRFLTPETDGFFAGPSGKSVALAMHRVSLGDYALTVVSEQNLRNALALPFRVTAIVVVLLLLVFALSGILGALAVKQIVRPVEGLADVARAIQAGDDSRKADASGDDEIADLAGAFNQMTTRLQGTLKELEIEVCQHKAADAARRKSEELLERVVNSAPIVLWAIDQAGTFTLSQGRGLGPLGLKPGQVVGRSVFEVYAGHEPVLQDTRAVLAGETRNTEWEVGGVCFDTRYTPYRDAEGAVAGAIGVALDITERKHLEAQLGQAQKLQALGTLAGGVAHDFNNLLQAIQGYADLLLLETDPAAPSHSWAQQLAKASDRGRELTSQLLAFSRKGESHRQILDVNDVARQTCQLLARIIPKMIEVRLELSADVRTVSADASQLERVLVNLGVNARDAMPEGGVLSLCTSNEVLGPEFCKTHPDVLPGPYVRISVRDTGQGMDEGTAKRIFEPFFTTKGPGRGTGLGLAVAYGIVRKHEGHILVESRRGKGSTFSVLLPAAYGLAAEEPVRPPDEIRGHETILFVDDEEDNRAIMDQVLVRHGYKAIAAADGESALEIYRTRRDEIDLVVLDLIMPGMGGWQCLNALLRMDPGVRVLIASGYSEKAPEELVEEGGARGLVSKPYRGNEILRAIRRILDSA